MTAHGYPEDYVSAMRRPFQPKSVHQALLRGDSIAQVPDMMESA
jgi:hypothetical protein